MPVLVIPVRSPGEKNLGNFSPVRCIGYNAVNHVIMKKTFESVKTDF